MDDNDTRNDSSLYMTRRKIIGGMGLALAAAPFAHILGCADSRTATGMAGSRGATGAAAWATEGTAAMIAGSAYPDPFTSGLDSDGRCELTCSQILGPCYAATLHRRDISEGQKGLPVRLAFRVVNEACAPIEGATVDIWHSSPKGIYSGNLGVEICNHDDAEARSANWFRGVQATDKNGRVNFDTCFPGWYPGRAIHIHFTVKAGTEHVTSQLYFDDALGDDITKTHPLYNTRGERDTKNTRDFVIAPEHLIHFTLQSQRMPDGALLAWKTLSLRSSTGAPLCTANSSTVQALMKAYPDFDTMAPAEAIERIKKNGLPSGVEWPESFLRILGLPVPKK